MQAVGAPGLSLDQIMSRYALASHVFACLDRDHIVLLDLKQDRYFSFEAAQARGLASSIAAHAEVANTTADDTVAERLVEQGLLIRNPATTSSRKAIAAPTPSAELVSDQYEDNAPRRMGYIGAFVRATASAAAVLRFGSLERAVRRVGERNAQRHNASSVFDTERTRELVAAFTDLRPFLFTSREACLFESLALIEFLARYSVFPAWIFGARARPFAAHCWVQHGDMVLNDTVEHVTRYTPIMAV